MYQLDYDWFLYGILSIETGTIIPHVSRMHERCVCVCVTSRSLLFFHLAFILRHVGRCLTPISTHRLAWRTNFGAFISIVIYDKISCLNCLKWSDQPAWLSRSNPHQYKYRAPASVTLVISACSRHKYRDTFLRQQTQQLHIQTQRVARCLWLV